MVTEIFIPKMGANIDRVEMGKIRVKAGDTVKKGDILFEVVTDKATFEVEADAPGKILQLTCREGDSLDVLAVVGFIGEEGEAIPAPAAQKKVKATPAARKLAKELGVDIDAKFSGSEQIIREDDLRGAGGDAAIRVQPQGFRKKAEVRHLSASRESIYSAVTIQVSVAALNEKVKACIAQHGVRLSPGELICFHAAAALKEFPLLNAYYSPAGVCAYTHVNLGIAMSPDDELMVPVIPDADALSLPAFLEKYAAFVMKAIRNTVAPQDMEHGTFTVTDLSSFGVFSFIPVLNEKQSGILGISSPYDSCREDGGTLVYEQKMNLTVAFDHRVLDGKYALAFLRALRERLG